MAEDGFAGLSPPQRAAAWTALTAAFGRAPVDAVAPVGGGATGAMPFRVEVGGRPYLLRLEGAAGPLRNPHQYACLRIAAAHGIAPRLHHVDEAARVVVMDFIAARPLRHFPGGRRGLAAALGAMRRRLQAVPAFPRFIDYPDLVARVFAHVRHTGLFADGLLDAHAARLEAIRGDLARMPAEAVASHNDCIPGNLLFDGARLWLIDWESACCNDPLVDVATLLDTLASTPALQEALLLGWLGHAPDTALRARLALVRALTRLFYAGVMLSGAATVPRARPVGDLAAPTLPGLRRAIRDGRLVAGTQETRLVLGKMFLAAFLYGAAPPGFDMAVAR